MKLFVKLFLFVLLIASCKSKKESSEFFGRGNYHFKKDEFDKALHFYNEAIKKDPKYADAYNNRGLTYIKLEENDKALNDFEKALSLDGGFTDAKFNLAKMYSENGKLPEAEKLFEEISPKMKQSSDYQNYVGQNYLRENNLSKALFCFNEAIKLKSNNVEAITNLGYLYFIENNYSKAQEQFEKALKINPKFEFAINDLAVVKYKINDIKNAISLLVNAEPTNNILIKNNLALFYLENKELVEAKSKIEEAEKIDADNPYTLRNKAILIFKNGDAKSALNILLNVEKTNPEVDYIYYFIGEMYTKLGDKIKACEAFKKGEALNDGKSKGKC